MMLLRILVCAFLEYATLLSASVVPSITRYTDRPPPNAHLKGRAIPPTIQYLSLQAQLPSATADLPALPTIVSDPAFNLTTNLTAAQTIQHRVPHSSIELYVTTTLPVDGPTLWNGLLAIHEWLNDEIASRGDSTLADRKDDPFVWLPSGPPRTPVGANLEMSSPVSLKAESAPSEHMTYGVLLVAVEGLFQCLPAVGRDYGAKFDIWDWRDQAMWGSGEVKAL